MQKKIYFCIMNNVFNTTLKIDYRFDLKGSTQGRKTDLPPGQVPDPTIALKDLDFLEQRQMFKVGNIAKEQLMQVIRRDTKFFAQQQIIDYSLLVGVHERASHP